MSGTALAAILLPSEIPMRMTAKSLLVLAFMAATCIQAADVWRWKDAQGVVHYSDVPVEGAVRVKRSVPSYAASSSTNGSAAGNGTAPVLTPEGVARIAEQKQLDAANKGVQQDVVKKRAEQCKSATSRYDTLITSNRVYHDDSKGQRTYLSAKELDEARVRARQDRDTACGAAVR
jgi:Domain of unknown function (DUF4124)